ncbi:MAG: ribose-phosphate diphosphokinase [Gammaproteobacteria bacterium]|nr:ribose-phosphate diphosphokinase [Gammaproteobacteria bacterium]
MLLLGFAESSHQARAIARQAGIDYAEIQVHHFPDGESRLTLPTSLPSQVAIYRSLDQPNSKLLELFLLSSALREAGVEELILIAPYLCYMRQDRAFAEGEVVSQKHLGKLLAAHFDGLITVDPHLHRTPQLALAVPVKHAIALHATEPMAEFLQQMPDTPVLLGPDEESRQWVEEIAHRQGLEFAVANKLRHGDRKVEIRLPELDYQDRHIILVDDVVSSGHTMAEAARGVLQAGASTVDCLMTHALFAEGAETLLQEAGIERIYSTDAIPHHSNCLSLAPLLAQTLRPLLRDS